MPNQEPAFTWPFGNGPVRVGTQGLFRLCLKTFIAPFLPARLTAPGSPRMGLPYVIGKPQIIHHKIATSKNVGNKNVTENCTHKSLSIIQPNYFFKDKCLKNNLEKDSEILKLQLLAQNYSCRRIYTFKSESMQKSTKIADSWQGSKNQNRSSFADW